METGILRRVLKRAKRWHFVADEVPHLPERKDVGRALALDEKLRLLRIAATRPQWESACMASVLALNTTMRGCEVKQLRWRDVNLVDRTLTPCESQQGERVGPARGKAKGPKVTTDPIEYVARPLKTVDDVTNLLADTINDLRSGTIGNHRFPTGKHRRYLATGMLKALQQGDIECRLRAVEAVLSSDKTPSKRFYRARDRAPGRDVATAKRCIRRQMAETKAMQLLTA